MVVKSNCLICGKEIIRNGNTAGKFCSVNCKGAFQLTQKPVDKAWLIQKYLKEGLSSYQIANIVKRNPKRVYEWLVEYGIPTRSRAETLSKNTYAHAEKLGAPNPFKGKNHTETTRKILSQKASVPKPYLRGENNGMFGRRGVENPNWKGGLTPERQAFYASIEWRSLSQKIYQRDRGTCQRCFVKKRSLNIHHIISFQKRETRLDQDNLILLCNDCHKWVHSKKNIKKEYLGEQNRIQQNISGKHNGVAQATPRSEH